MTNPGNQPPQPPQFGYPPAQPPRKKFGAGKIVLIVVGAVIALCVLGGVIVAAVGGGKTSNTSSGSGDKPAAQTTTKAAAAKPKQQAAKPKNTAPHIGQPARDGKFEFVVTSVTYGKTQVGTEYVGKKAQGQFVMVAVTVKNIGDQAQTFDASSQKATGPGGVTYSADSAAGIYANTNDQTFLNEINPGNQAQGTLVFDIPKTAKLSAIELHDSPFSDGVTVDLT